VKREVAAEKRKYVRRKGEERRTNIHRDLRKGRESGRLREPGKSEQAD